MLSAEDKKLLELFRNHGIYGKTGKVKLLKKYFNLELPEPHSRIISNLKDIRDCLSHRNGIVGQADGAEDSEGNRKFHWATFEIFCIGEESGKKFELEFDKPLAEAATLCARIDTKDNFKSFKVGESLSFSSSEAYEIAWSLQMITQEYLRQINEKVLTRKAG